MHGLREKKLAKDLAKLFKAQARDIAARIEQLQTLELDLLFHPRSWDGRLLDVLRSNFLRTATAGADLEQSLFKSAKVFGKIAAKIKAGVEKALKLPLWQELQDTTKEILAKTLDAAKKAGQSIADAVKAVKAALGGKAADARSRNAARTETTAALGLGAEAVRQYYAELGNRLRKQWLTMGDELVRPAHEELDGVTIDYDDSFNVGGHRAAFPGDFGLPAELRCGCRCSVITLMD